MSPRFLSRALLLIVLTPLPASAQPASPPADRLTVSLLTMGHGDAIYEWFGHNAILIEDSATGKSIAYNYGLFTFEDENFILRFLQGRMMYWMAGSDGAEVVADYRAMNRSVLKQELNLSPRQKLALANFLRWNEQPKNAYYRYDYYTANCSTKVRDALDLVLDGQLKKYLEGICTDRTYRWHTRRLSRANPVMYSALYYVLGQPVDVYLNGWQESFLPSQLATHLNHAVIVDEAGKMVPLVRSETMLYLADRPPLPPGPPNWIGAFLAIGTIVGGSIYGLARLSHRGRRYRVVLAVLAGFWLLLTAGAGAFSAGIWLLTTHVAAYRNENLLQFNPLALPLVILMPMLALQYKRGISLAWYTAATVLAYSILGLLIQLLAPFNQVNGEMIALMLPANLGLFLAIHRLASDNRPEPQAPDVSPSPRLNPQPSPAR